MNALETRPVNRPTVGQLTPFHPETNLSFDDVGVEDLPSDEDRSLGTRWTPTGFTIQSVDNDYVRGVLKERFFHNPAVGYTFRLNDATVVEYEYQPIGVRVPGALYGVGSHIPQGACSEWPRK